MNDNRKLLASIAFYLLAFGHSMSGYTNPILASILVAIATLLLLWVVIDYIGTHNNKDLLLPVIVGICGLILLGVVLYIELGPKTIERPPLINERE